MFKWFANLFRRKKAKMEITTIIYDEQYWDAKHPKSAQMYDGRPLPSIGRSFPMDVRHFIWHDDIILKKILKNGNLVSDSNDETAGRIQKFVVDSLKYVGDSAIGKSEYWLFAGETLEMRAGDCEDGAILMASLLLNALPAEHHWRVRVSAGFVQSAPTAPQGGHAYCSYCRCSDNQWVALDWCYYEDSEVSVAKKPLIKNVQFYKDVWFSFNHKFSWAHTNFAMSGRVKKI